MNDKNVIFDDEQKDKEKLYGFISEYTGIALKDVWLKEFELGEQLARQRIWSGYKV